QYDGADHGGDQRPGKAAGRLDAEHPEQPAADKGADDADNDVHEQAGPALHDKACNPAGQSADGDPEYDVHAFTSACFILAPAHPPAGLSPDHAAVRGTGIMIWSLAHPVRKAVSTIH